MTSRAERRRRKKAADAGLPEVAPVPKKQPSGRRRRGVRDRDAARDALEARCRQMGIEPTQENIRDIRAPWWGCNAGRAMAGVVSDHSERAGLWDAICHMRRVQVAFDAAIGAPRRHAQCLRLLLPVERMEATAETPALDDRTPEDRQRHATAALMQVDGWLGWTDSAAASQCRRVVLDDARVTDAEGLVSALRCVSDGLSGRQMVYRGGRA